MIISCTVMEDFRRNIVKLFYNFFTRKCIGTVIQYSFGVVIIERFQMKYRQKLLKMFSEQHRFTSIIIIRYVEDMYNIDTQYYTHNFKIDFNSTLSSYVEYVTLKRKIQTHELVSLVPVE